MAAWRRLCASAGVVLTIAAALVLGDETPPGTGQVTAGSSGPPYPPSPVITSITWAPAESIVRRAQGGDNWPLTWADDGAIYTAYGDGSGFEPRLPVKLSLGFARVTGTPADFLGENIRSPTGERTGDGASGEKASGLLMVEGVLYMWVRNADGAGCGSRLAWSTDHARTWQWADWEFAELGYPCSLNFGRNYDGARDEYVYTYSPDSPSAYREADAVVLARVPKVRIADRGAYEFFRSRDVDGRPTWTADIGQRGDVFVFPGGCNRMDVVYNRPLSRYLMTMRSRGRVGGRDHFSIYDAPKPWGPWTTVFYTEEWEGRPIPAGAGGWGEAQRFPAKWISEDGLTLYLVFSGDDSFSVRRVDLVSSGTVELREAASIGARRP